MSSKIRFRTYSMFVGKKHEDDWYEWCVFVDETSDVITKVRSVEYVLHPTFPEPVRLVSAKESRFALFSSGWGGFIIQITVYFEDGSTQKTDHDLELKTDSWPRWELIGSFRDEAERSVYQALFDEKYRWRKVETIVRRTQLSDQRVSEILKALEIENLARQAPSKSIDNKELWGATAIVGIAPRFSLPSPRVRVKQNKRGEV